MNTSNLPIPSSISALTALIANSALTTHTALLTHSALTNPAAGGNINSIVSIFAPFRQAGLGVDISSNRHLIQAVQILLADFVAIIAHEIQALLHPGNSLFALVLRHVAREHPSYALSGRLNVLYLKSRKNLIFHRPRHEGRSRRFALVFEEKLGVFGADARKFVQVNNRLARKILNRKQLVAPLHQKLEHLRNALLRIFILHFLQIAEALVFNHLQKICSIHLPLHPLFELISADIDFCQLILIDTN